MDYLRKRSKYDSGVDEALLREHRDRAIGRKRYIEEDDALERGDGDDDDDGLPYQPAPDSPSNQKPDSDLEDDPLDSYMAEIESQAHKDKAACGQQKTSQKDTKVTRTDIEEADLDVQAYEKAVDSKKFTDPNEDDIVEYDADGNPIYTWKKKIDPLGPLDHSAIEYQPFDSNFYKEHEDIQNLSYDEVGQLMKALGLSIFGLDPPRPVSSFAHFKFDKHLMDAIRNSEFTQPTPIQALAVPGLMKGRDLVGIAKTGSGKSCAYIWPAIVHIMHQAELEEGEGPIALICVPTRELAIQVYNEVRKYGKVYKLQVICAYGGGSKWEQTKACQTGGEVIVATPGRLIDLINIDATNLRRVTFLVFDEADRMFDLGFEPQVRSIADHVRPDRQCVMFSATFKRKVEKLARDILRDPIKIVQGDVGVANEDVIQTIELVKNIQEKLSWLTTRLVEFCSYGKVLIFVTRKQNCEELAATLRGKGYTLGLLHGDMFQNERNDVLHAFRSPSCSILVATDVAARGLDIPEIRNVVNFDVARDLDTHVHRIGRTGRAGEKGWAYTLVTDKDREFAGHLVRNLESVGQTVPPELFDLAMKSSWFKKQRGNIGAESMMIAGPPGSSKQGLGFGSRYATPNQGVPKIAGGTSTPSSFSSPLPPGPRPPTVHQFREPSKRDTDEEPQSRLGMLKSRLSASYQKRFHGATAETAWKNTRPTYTDPTPDWVKKCGSDEDGKESRKRKSRWNE